MNTAERLIETCQDSFGYGLPTIQDIINWGGNIIDNSAWRGNVDAFPFTVWEFSDKSCLVFQSGYNPKVLSYSLV